MKYYYTLVLYFIFQVSLAQVTFQKRFGHPQNNVSEYVYDGTLDPWGNLYIIGANNLETFNVTKVDSFGQTLWMKTLSSINIEPSRIIFSSDSNLMVLGRGSLSSIDNYIFLTKTDTSGNIIWSRYLATNGRFNLTKLLFEDNNGNLIIGGYQSIEFDSVQFTYREQPFLAKFDSGGTLNWFKQVEGIYTAGFNDGIKLPNGNYLMTGFVGDTILGDKDILLLETDSSGIFQRSIAIGNTTLDLGQKVINVNHNILIAATDNNLSSIAAPHFIELDSSWNILLNKKNITPGGSTLDIIPYLNGSYLVSSNGPMLYIIDSTLTLVQGKNYGNSGFNRRLYKSFNIGDGRVFSCGTNGDVSDILVLRTDSTLDAGCNSYSTILFTDTVPQLLTEWLNFYVSDTVFNSYSFDSIISHVWSEIELCNSYTGLIVLNDNLKFKVDLYPNPTTETLNVFVDGDLNMKKIHLEVFDIYGRSYFTEWRDFIPQSSILLDISFLPNGNYIIKLTTNENYSVAKFIISK
ncbi:MAG: T9SS type A sorting domain-containing protein [Bacteroidota bacterium]|nr:T9SS type A sorting domain-containing protein [Bacteroidota bacterium]